VFIAGSILQIEPKRLGSGYKPEPAQVRPINLIESFILTIPSLLKGGWVSPFIEGVI
jgi:hypothetical protein